MILSSPSSAESATICCWFRWFEVLPVRGIGCWFGWRLYLVDLEAVSGVVVMSCGDVVTDKESRGDVFTFKASDGDVLRLGFDVADEHEEDSTKSYAVMAMYGVTKTALLGLTKALATEMAPHTRVNCVAPGTVPTHFASFITDNDTIRNAIEEKTPFKRLGTPEDMAAATAFLASDEASYITGETIVVAGGMSSRLFLKYGMCVVMDPHMLRWLDGIGRLILTLWTVLLVLVFAKWDVAVSDWFLHMRTCRGMAVILPACSFLFGDGSQIEISRELRERARRERRG
ncbi:tropinone reductase-like protein 3 [Tanacetum coccineum]|uniref:Tropinone reductase-like protein 3 n=1 Tax=Tanacetum coccineum TaxID=301880 RepID=A0ABQ5J0R3_9ASTR